MKLTLGGVRGSKPVTNFSFMNFGGDTSAYLVRDDDGNGVLVDLGTGVGVIEPVLNDPSFNNKKLLILITHYHVDHLLGVLYFKYARDWDITIAGPDFEGHTAERVLHSIVRPPLWPLGFSDMFKMVKFKTLEELSLTSKYEYLGWTISWCKLRHPGGCVSYRFDEHRTGESLVIATDVEWGASTQSERQEFLDFCLHPKVPEVLVFDGHFSPNNVEKFRTWGHSSWEEATDVANQVKPRKLIITHHDPANDDDELLVYEQVAKEMYSASEFARQGDTFDLDMFS